MTVGPLYSNAAGASAVAAIGGEFVGEQEVQLLKQIFVSVSGIGGGSGGSLAGLIAASEMSAPAANAAAVTPSASPLANPSRAVYVGTGGALNVTMVGGQTVLFGNVPDGTTLPIRVTHILAASTDADDVVSLW